MNINCQKQGSQDKCNQQKFAKKKKWQNHEKKKNGTKIKKANKKNWQTKKKNWQKTGNGNLARKKNWQN